MLSKRPLMYLTVPGIVVMLGLMWFRRKKTIHCDTGGKKPNVEQEIETTTIANNNLDNINVRKLQHTTSMPINCVADKNKQKNEHKICKSAPIDINPKKSSPAKISDERIDMDILKMKIQINDDKTLNSIKETDLESISSSLDDLPDSIERKRFSFPIRKTECEPIVIKATTAPKISPKHSFAESKFHENVEDDVREVKENCVESEQQKSKFENNVVIINSPLQRKSVLSPPLSLCSVQSNDSGKGSSPPHSEGAPALIYEFVLPQKLIGQMLGRKGQHIRQMKSKSGANILIKKHPDSHKSKICAIEGTQKEIDAALKMIRQKFPEKRYPKLTMQRVYFTPSLQTIIAPIVSSHLKLHLIEGINNDVTVSSLISGGHLFFHQPLHPSYPSLSILQNCMNQSYTFCESPILEEVTTGIVCAAFIQNNWFRIEVISNDNETQTCVIKYLDYGGYSTISYTDLRQIRTDFMTIPFQAIECVLGNLKPSGDEWSYESVEALNSLTQSLILQAQVLGYTLDGLPEVHLYARLAPNRFVFVNKELVARNLAEWVDEIEIIS